MAAIDILHPLINDTVGTAVNVLVAWDLDNVVIRTNVVLKCRVYNSTNNYELTANIQTGGHGETPFSFPNVNVGITGMADYTVLVTTDPDHGSDTEAPIHVTSAPPLTMNPPQAGGNPGTYVVTGTSTAGSNDPVTVAPSGLNPNHTLRALGRFFRSLLGSIRARSRANKWNPGVGQAVPARFTSAHDWTADVIARGNHRHFSFKATRRSDGKHISRGRPA